MEQPVSGHRFAQLFAQVPRVRHGALPGFGRDPIPHHTYRETGGDSMQERPPRPRNRLVSNEYHAGRRLQLGEIAHQLFEELYLSGAADAVGIDHLLGCRNQGDDVMLGIMLEALERRAQLRMGGAEFTQIIT